MFLFEFIDIHFICYLCSVFVFLKNVKKLKKRLKRKKCDKKKTRNNVFYIYGLSCDQKIDGSNRVCAVTLGGLFLSVTKQCNMALV